MESIEINANLWWSQETQGNYEILGDPWIAQDIYGQLWISMGTTEYMKSMKIYRKSSTYVSVYEIHGT